MTESASSVLFTQNLQKHAHSTSNLQQNTGTRTSNHASSAWFFLFYLSYSSSICHADEHKQKTHNYVMLRKILSLEIEPVRRPTRCASPKSGNAWARGPWRNAWCSSKCPREWRELRYCDSKREVTSWLNSWAVFVHFINDEERKKHHRFSSILLQHTFTPNDPHQVEIIATVGRLASTSNRVP